MSSVPSVVVCLIPWPSWAKAVVVVVAKTLVTTTTVAASTINTIAYLVLLAIAILQLQPK